MHKFDFFSVPRLVFGRGQFARLPELAASMGSTALVVYNGDEQGRGGALDRLIAMVSVAGMRYVLFRQNGEPKVEDVDRAIAAGKQGGCDMVIALGGGSAIDAAKAAAGLLANGGSALDYMEVVGKGQKIAKPALRWIAVPTTAGTGAEATRNAVIGFPEKQFKASIRSELLLPRVALVDPELTVGNPRQITASSGMDALCQCIESYTSNAAEPMTDALVIEGVARAGRSLRRAYENGQDLEAREDMSLAALLSGIALTNVGLGAVHGFAAPMGANFPIPHGTVCALLLPHVMSANVAALRAHAEGRAALARYASIGRTLAGPAAQSEESAIDAGIEFTASLARDLAIPPLSRFGFDEQDIAPMVALARKSSSMRYNPVALSDEALAGILRRAM